jgi:REP element-mobilizing transposase RayT
MPQSLSQVLVHLVFFNQATPTFITQEIEPELYAYIAKILYDECHSPAMIIGGTKDHLHILLVQSRIWSMARIVELIKKRSSKWIKTKGNEFNAFQWQAGYGAFSVSVSNASIVKRYIADQKEHHHNNSYQDEFRIFLKKHNIEYDEKYVWN